MMTLMNLVYALPLVIALVIAGAVVHGRVMGTARTLMWSGIAAVCLTRLAGMSLPALVTGGSMVAYGVANLILNVLATVGIVLLVVAVGVAARAVPGGGAYPGPQSWQQSGSEPTGFPTPGASQPNQYPQHSGYGHSQPSNPQAPQQTDWTNPGGYGHRP